MVILLDSIEVEIVSIFTDCSVGLGSGWGKVSGAQLACPVLSEWSLLIWVTAVLRGEGNRFVWKLAGFSRSQQPVLLRSVPSLQLSSPLVPEETLLFLGSSFLPSLEQAAAWSSLSR